MIKSAMPAFTSPTGALLLRERLIEAIGLPHRVTLIQGSRNSGKSVLVKSWLASTWLGGFTVVKVPAPTRGMDEDDYWWTIAEALARTVRKGCDSHRSLPLGVRFATVMESVDASILAAAEDKLLVLDQPVRLTNGRLESDLLDLLSRHPRLHLVVSIRTPGLFSNIGALVKDYRRISPDDLKFTREETGRLFDQVGAHLPASLVDKLHRELGGSPLLVQTATNELWRFAGQQSSRKIALTELQEVVLMVLDAAISECDNEDLCHDAVILAAVMRERDSQILTTMLGVDAMSIISNAMNEFGPFLNVDQWQLIPIVRAAVLRRLQERRDGMPRAYTLLERLQSELVESEDYCGALECALVTENWPLLWPVLRERWPLVFAREPHLLRDVLLALPGDLAAQDPAVSAAQKMFVGVDAGTIDALNGRAGTLGEFVAADGSNNRSVADVISAETVRAIIYRLAGDFATSSDQAKQISVMIAGIGSTERSELARFLPIMRLQWGINHQLADRYEDAELEFRYALSGASAGDFAFVARESVGSLAMSKVLRGEVNYADKWIAAESQYDQVDGWLGPRVRIPGLVARVMAALDRHDICAAEALLKELGEPDDTEERWAPMVVAQCGVLQALGQTELALDSARRAASRYRRWNSEGSMARRLLALTTARLYCSLGYGNAALAALSFAPQDHPETQAVRGTVLLLAGNATGALAEVEVLTRHTVELPRAVITALMVSGAANDQLNDHDQAKKAFLRATEVARQSGLSRSLFILPRSWRNRLIADGLIAQELADIWGKWPETEINPDSVDLIDLSPRETAVVKLLAGGDTLQTIAKDLFVSQNTVKAQLQSIYRKLSVTTRDDAVRAARAALII